MTEGDGYGRIKIPYRVCVGHKQKEPGINLALLL
tara:strand:- start:4482 stop:4583 length:102 start_codon:yes stop_codon:yes gene_type:complete